MDKVKKNMMFIKKARASGALIGVLSLVSCGGAGDDIEDPNGQTPTPTVTVEATPTTTPTPTPTPSPEPTPEPSPEFTPTPTPELSPTPTPSPSPDPTLTVELQQRFDFEFYYSIRNLSIHRPGHYLAAPYNDFFNEPRVLATNVDAQSEQNARAAASFRLVPGLANEKCYSFTLPQYEDYYLRADWFGGVDFVKRSDFASELHAFDGRSTFCLRQGLGGEGVSFEAYTNPGYFLALADSEDDFPGEGVRLYNGAMKWAFEENRFVLYDYDTNYGEFERNASWQLEASLKAPEASQRKDLQDYAAKRSLRVITQGYSHNFATVANQQGITQMVNVRSDSQTQQNAEWIIRGGLADAHCYSLQWQDQSGPFLRRAGNAVQLSYLDRNDASMLADSTFCAEIGRANNGYSLYSYSATDHYLVHRGGQLMFDTPFSAWAFDQDASWDVVAPITEKPPAVYPAPGQTQSTHALPVTVATTEFLGAQSSTAPFAYERDLGFTGVLNGEIIWTFGDVLTPNANGDGHQFCTSDMGSIGDITNVMQVTPTHVLPDGCGVQWIPLTDEEEKNGALGRWAIGTSSVVEIAPNNGLAFYWLNDRGDGTDNYIGGGIAHIEMTSGGPVVERNEQLFWQSYEPLYGDIGIVYNPEDGHVYAYGHGRPSVAAGLDEWIFLTRVQASQADDIQAYEYWDGKNKVWMPTPYGDGRDGTVLMTPEHAVFNISRQVGQSTPFWSNHYQKWMFIHGRDWGWDHIFASTADSLEGPWTHQLEPIARTCTENGEEGGPCSGAFRYAITPHPEYDPSGKTLLVSWTEANVIYLKRLTFE